MNYKEITVCSAGKEKTEQLIDGVIILILWVVLCIESFRANPFDDSSIIPTMTDHIKFGLFVSIMSSFIAFAGITLIHFALIAIKRKCDITLRLYRMEDFVKIGKLSEQEIVFADLTGVVTCDKNHAKQYSDWDGLSNDKKFSDFVKYVN